MNHSLPSVRQDHELAEMLGLSSPGTPLPGIQADRGGGGTAPLLRFAQPTDNTSHSKIAKSNPVINSTLNLDNSKPTPGINSPGHTDTELIPKNSKSNSGQINPDAEEIRKLEEEINSWENSNSANAREAEKRRKRQEKLKQKKMPRYIPVESRRLKEIRTMVEQKIGVSISKEQRETLMRNLQDKAWRLENLYLIKLEDGGVAMFVMRHEQKEFMRNRARRNFVPKARKLGISTFIVLDALDECMFPPRGEDGKPKKISCGIVDLKETDAWAKLAIAKFAVEHGVNHPRPEIAWLWRELLAANPLVTDSNSRMEWKNGCSFEAGTNYTGKTPQRLHISEYGPISDEHPETAKRIKQGSMNAVPPDGIIDIETTMQGGRLTECYAIFELALRNLQLPVAERTDLHWKLHYFSWLRHPSYKLPGRTPKDAETMEYFAGLTKKYRQQFIDMYGFGNGEVPLERQAWYEIQKHTQRELMWQQYPTVLEEVDRVSLTGQIYPEMMRVRVEGRVRQFNPQKGVALYISSDIGSSDHSAYWLCQHYNGADYFIDCAFGVGMGANGLADTWRRWCMEYQDYVIEQIILPHDGATDDRGSGLSFRENLEKFGVPSRMIEVVPRTTDMWNGVNLVRSILVNAVFHTRTDQKVQNPDDPDRPLPSGIGRLEGYRRVSPSSTGAINNKALGDICSHAADGVRNAAEAAFHGLIKSRKSSLVPGMTGSRSRWQSDPSAVMPWASGPSWEKGNQGNRAKIILP